MLVTRNLQPSLWDSVLPQEVRRLSPLLEQVDRWLDDEAFFAPFRPHFSALLGRPSIPMEVYLRMMFLKYQYRLGYESVCREVSDSISWRIFCRLNLDDAVPSSSTLSKITTRCGEEAVLGLNEALLARADAAKLVKTGKVRADTTVVSANVEYPTDSGLLAHAVTRIGKLVGRIKAAGEATRTMFRDATETAATMVHAIGAKLRLRTADAKQEAQTTVLRLTGELAGLADQAIAEAGAVLDNARRALHRVAGWQRGKLRKAISELSTLVIRAARVVAQTRRRVASDKVDSATRLVSLHDPDARPIVKGRLGKPVEFGYKAQVVDNEDGVVLDYDVKTGNPADADQLAPAITRIRKRFGRVPEKATADCGYGEAAVDRRLEELGVATVVIPRKGTPGKARQELEHSLPRTRQVAHRQRGTLMDGHEFGVAGALRICGQMLDALEYLHQDCGYLHRDVKPGNVLLDQSRENAVLADLGSAGRIDPSDGTAPNYGGTPLYLAPEAKTTGRVTLRFDLYSLGVLTVEMLAGRFPYEDIDLAGVDARLAVGRRALTDRPAPRAGYMILSNADMVPTPRGRFGRAPAGVPLDYFDDAPRGRPTRLPWWGSSSGFWFAGVWPRSPRALRGGRLGSGSIPAW